ncbi:isoflavone reductase family protein-like protein CipA [Plenodomus tracheiphilus IPT5]|uniref:Isoflavone reductase family protein-like protein CipA n=1 Tax=Plenodomus tracheiphilus IPT5 TaxID=1408161 RepID=A0A6A7AW80_9PLEO|nr:isoflavone reductase family protein-like protein CipA [Plenodomus tracheiphilus IPT5]
MSSTITNVAIAGATGTLGSILLDSIVKASRFNVTVIARKDVHPLPNGVIVKVVDTNSVSLIADALRGQDAFIDASSGPDPTLPGRFIEAAAAAGVYRMIPSEFTSDVQHAEARSPLVFHGKNGAFQQLQKLASDHKITYTTISNGAFLDWNLRTGFINIDIFGKKVQYMNDGNLAFPWTKLQSVATAVVNVLMRPQETENRSFYISSVLKSQKQMVELAKDVLGKDGWEETSQNMNDRLKSATADMMAGKVDMVVIGDMIRWSTQIPQPRWEQQDDNKLLGVKPMSDDEVRKLIKDIAAERK